MACPGIAPAGTPWKRAASALTRVQCGFWVWLSCLWLGGVTLATGQTVTTLVSLTNQVWRFNDAGTDLGSGWQAINYSTENNWSSGTALFGVESSFPYPYPFPVRTSMILNAGRTTYYFRTHFNFTAPPNRFVLLATGYIDDGAIFYLNGVEAGRVRLPEGPVTFSTKAQLAYPEGQPVIMELDATNLRPTDNVLAVELHQASDASSDVVFGLALETFTLEAPAILDPSQPADRMVKEGEGVTLEVSANGFPPPTYQWFRNGALIPGAINPSLTLDQVTAANAGNYYVVITNLAGSIISRTNTVSFLADTNPPTILYALGLPNLQEVRLVFSEPVNEEIARDFFNWSLEVAGGAVVLNLIDGRLENGTNLVLTSLEFRDPELSYTVTTQVPIPDPHGNVLPQGTIIPLAWFEAPLLLDSATQMWRYEQSGTDLGGNWFKASYSDATWPAGLAPFDAFRRGEETCRPSFPATGDLIRTCLTLSNALATAQIPTSYFRSHFNFRGNPSNVVLRLDAIINDGAVFYLNGTELIRVGMPDGPISYDTLANVVATDAVFERYEAAAPTLVAGDNLLAVELHQQSLSSFDFTLSVRVTGVLPIKPVSTPQLSLQRSLTSLEITWSPTDGTLESADQIGGPWTEVNPSNPPGQHIVAMTEAQKFFRVVVR